MKKEEVEKALSVYDQLYMGALGIIQAHLRGTENYMPAKVVIDKITAIEVYYHLEYDRGQRCTMPSLSLESLYVDDTRAVSGSAEIQEASMRIFSEARNKYGSEAVE
jgi:hypothetical protein